MFSIRLSVIIICFVLFAGCSKKSGTDDTPTPNAASVQSAEFTTNASIYWSDEAVVVTAVDKSGTGNAYLWEWGDNQNSVDKSSSSHRYANGGTYTIKLTVNNHVYSKVVNLRLGNCSYQINNLSNYIFYDLGVVDNIGSTQVVYTNPFYITLYPVSANKKSLSDTLYLYKNTDNTYTDNFKLTGFIAGPNLFTQSQTPIVAFSSSDLNDAVAHQHTIFTFSNNTNVSFGSTKDQIGNYLNYVSK